MLGNVTTHQAGKTSPAQEGSDREIRHLVAPISVATPPEPPPPARGPWPNPARPWARSASSVAASVVLIDPCETGNRYGVGVPAAQISRVAGAGAAFLLAGAVASPWNGINLDGLQPGDGLLATGLSLLLISAARERRSLALPWWLSLLAVVAALTALTQVFLPVDRATAAQRFVLLAYGGGGPDQPSDTLVNLLHWEVALLALPLAAVLAARVVRDFAQKLATAWLIGCTLSALVALTDALGVTSISASLLPFTAISGRQAGLTAQPNTVAVAAAMALPVAVYWATGLARRPSGAGTDLAADSGLSGGSSLAPRKPGTGRLGRLFGLVCIVVLLGGTFVARSRGGSGAAGLASLQAWQDVDHAPLRGIEPWVITESHSMYLQLLAAGGIALLLAFVVFLVRATGTGLAFSRLTGDAFGTLTAISLSIWAVVGAVENQLTDRYLYLPAACAACLAVTLADRASAEADDFAAETDPLSRAPVPGPHPKAARPEYIVLP